MNTNKKELNVLIIGAGAAGLAAGRKLKQAGIKSILLEGRDRVGGRVWTDYDMAEHPVELGGEWVLGDKAISCSLLREFGLHRLTGTEFNQYSAYINDQLLDSPAFNALDNASEMFTFESISNGLETWQDTGRADGSLSDIIDELDMEKEMLALYRNRVALDYAAEATQLGVHGMFEADDASYGDGYFRVKEGYSQLMKKLAEGQDIRLNTAVNRIEWQDNSVTVHTRTGEQFEADRVIITLPLAVLQDKDVSFEPSLPVDKLTAINGLGCGKVTKIIFKFKQKFWPDDMPGVWTTMNTQVWYRPGQGRENEAAILTGYVGGDASDHFATLGEAATIEESLRQLEQMFSVNNLREQLVSSKVVVWAQEEFSKMAYSYVPVGAAGLRDKLATPLGNALFFAGEATNRECPSLVHGALQTGYRAADEVIAENQ